MESQQAPTAPNLANSVRKLNPSMRHRLINENDDATAVSVADSVHALADQAKNLIILIQDQYDEDREDRIPDKTLYHALSAVSGLIEDMRSICHAYHKASREMEANQQQ
jgi:hypothetical protein